MELTMNKMGFVVIITLVLIISIFGIKMWYDNTREYTLDQRCRISVQSHSRLIDYGLPARNDDIDCPPKEITLRKSDDVKRILAEDLKRCWDNFGKGELNLFKEEEGLFCSICSIMDSKDDIEVEDFTSYLAETPIKGSRQTYLSYLIHYETFDAKVLDSYEGIKAQDKVEGDSFTLSSEGNYATIFVYAKGDNAVKKYINIGKNVGVGATGVLTGVAVGYGIIKLGAFAQILPLAGTSVGLIAIGVGGTIIGVSAIYASITSWVVAADAEWYSEVVLRDYTQDTLESLGCTHVPVRLLNE